MTSTHRESFRIVLLAGLAGFASGGCTPRTLELGPTVPTLVQVGDAPRAVLTLTDLDDVRDVAAGTEHVFVATDRGVLVYPGGSSARPVRLTREDGLPGEDVHAVEATTDVRALVATDRGLATVEAQGTDARMLAGDSSSIDATPPPVGEVMDLARTRRGVTWACGLRGLARLGEDGWERFGESSECLRLTVTPEDHLWAGTTQGALYVEDDVVREHAPRQGIPASYVRDLAPLDEAGEVLALVQDSEGARIAHWDGERWYGYVVPEFDRAPVGLARRAGEVLMLTPDHAFAIAREREDVTVEGVPLTMLSRSDRYGARSYRARITPAARVPPPAEELSRADVLEASTRMAELPVGHEEPEAPRFRIRPIGAVAEQAYRVRRAGGAIYVADRNRGVVELPASGGEGRRLRSRNLVAEDDLQVASDATGATWVVTDEGDVGLWRDGAVVRVSIPDELRPQTVTDAREGAYLIALVRDEPGLVRALRVGPSGFQPVLERTLQLDAELAGIAFAGVDHEDRVWLGVQVPGDDGPRTRGVAVLDPATEDVVYHHRAADREQGALPMPDGVRSVDLGDPGMAWFASFSGAVRVGNHQAVVFGEARGVPGEIVTDLAVGDGRVWIAAAEGLGYYQNKSLEFGLAGYRKLRPRALAIDERGRVWGAGPNGAIWFDGSTWHRLTREQGLPTESLEDVETDARGRVWFLAGDRVLVFTPPPH